MLIASTRIILTMFHQIIWHIDKCQNHTLLAQEKEMISKVRCTFLSSLLVCSGNHKVMYQTGQVYVKVILTLFPIDLSLNLTKRERRICKTLVQIHPYSKENLYLCFEVQKRKTLKLWNVSDSLPFRNNLIFFHSIIHS